MTQDKIKVLVITGGLSNERDISIKSARQVFDSLSKYKYDKYLVEITNNGQWLLTKDNFKIGCDGAEEKALTIIHPDRGITKNDLNNFDVAFLALHGKFGEDGKIQAILDILRVPYTGSGVLASSLAMNKFKTMQFLNSSGFKTPKFLYFSDSNNIDLENINKLILQDINYPCIVKPNASGSSIGISLVNSFSDLKTALDRAYKEDGQILIEEYIKGREFTCGVLGNSNSSLLEVFPPVEIITNRDFFDYNAKYISKKTQEICPAKISEELTKKIKIIAKNIHKIIGCDGLSRSDFILKDDDFYFLEINTIPGLTEDSLCPKEVEAMGITFSDFIDKQIELALDNKK